MIAHFYYLTHVFSPYGTSHNLPRFRRQVSQHCQQHQMQMRKQRGLTHEWSNQKSDVLSHRGQKPHLRISPTPQNSSWMLCSAFVLLSFSFPFSTSLPSCSRILSSTISSLISPDIIVHSCDLSQVVRHGARIPIPQKIGNSKLDSYTQWHTPAIPAGGSKVKRSGI